MKVETVSIESLREDAANARAHGERNLTAIKASLARFGQQHPIVVGPDGLVVAGNGRLAAMRALGWQAVKVIRTDLEGAERIAFAIADNRTAELAEWDEAILAATLRGLLDDPTFEPEAIGFDDAEIEAILRRSDPLPEITESATPPKPEDPRTKPGDLWLLGDHRVLCADATDAAAAARLHGGEVPFLLVTDPPYGVEYNPKWRDEAAEAGAIRWGTSQRVGEVPNDDRFDWSAVLASTGASVAYVWCASWYLPEVGVALSSAGFERRALIVWTKPHFAISRGHYHWQHEPAWYAVRKGSSSRWCGDRSQSTVWSITQSTDDQQTRHGTQKPVEAMARPIRNHGARGDLVFDPFVGSGTTIVAAQLSGRRCHAIDIDPGYVDVTVRRWQALTGERAVHADTGEAFPEA